MNISSHKYLARVFQSGKRSFVCRLEHDGIMVEAVALAVLLKDQHIVVGDWVYLEFAANGNHQIVETVKRRNQITRFIPRENKLKVTAANCDVLAIVMSISKPEYKRGLVDRYLIRAEEWDLNSYLIFNKMDEYNKDSSPDLIFESERLSKLNIPCFEISAKNPNYAPQFLKNGMNELKTLMSKKTVAFVGQSGVGKSKTISTLSGGEVELLTGDLGKIGKGSHTTTWAQMLDCQDFFLIDSPGIRSFSVEDVLEEDLITYFPDLAEIARFCKFTSCEHNPHDRGCAFYTDKFDEKDQALILSRLESFKKILGECGEIPSWKKKKT